MASSRDKVVHQDYIARIRYSNALPPPPNPPKLLDIPGTGLASGQYTSAGYASRLAREQPLNIEADAELGMPIDLVGIPGIFDGDERAIFARPGTQSIHPADRALLRPLASLGKPNAASGAVSFLRRTEYTSSQNSQHFSSSTSKDLLRVRNDPKRRKANVNQNDPINIMRSIIKGFDIAYPKDAYKGEDSTTDLRGASVTDPEIKAWSQPRHPTRPDLKLLDTYPVLPDLEALPTTGFYMVMKFTNNPVAASDTYNEALDSAILQPIQDAETQAEFEQRMAEWDPQSGRPEPIPEYSYDYFLPADSVALRGLKRKLDVNDPERDDPELYGDEPAGDGQRAFKYLRLRTYETQNQHGDQHNLYNDSIAMALHDADTDIGAVPGVRKRLAKGAYYYPIVQRTALRPKRKVGLSGPDAEPKIEELNVTVVDMGEDLHKEYLAKRALFDPAINVDELAG